MVKIPVVWYDQICIIYRPTKPLCLNLAIKRRTGSLHQALIYRGLLTFWIDEEAIASWQTKAEQGKKGRPRLFSDLSITTLMAKRIFNMRKARLFNDWSGPRSVDILWLLTTR